MNASTKMGPTALGLLLAFGASAQDHTHHQVPAATSQDHSQQQVPAPATQDHPDHQVPPKAKPKPEPTAEPKSKPAQEASEPIDHAAMGHAPDSGIEHPAAIGHDVPPAPAEGSDHDAMGHGATPQEPEVDHAAMGHGTRPAGPEEEVDHSAMDHAPMDHTSMGHTAPRAANEPITPIPPVTDEDRAAAVPPANDHAVHDNSMHSYVAFNRLEGFETDEGSGLEWEGQAWFGTDRNKLWLRTEGERVGGHTEAADLEVLYGRPIARWWDLVAGIRHDFKPGDSQVHAAIGVMGLAPYKFELEATAYIGEHGKAAARFEVEYETLLTNRLILQPLVELNFHGETDHERGIGSGLSTAEVGLRLRYEIRREIAPYVGIVHERAFGRTADFRRDEGEDIEDTRWVAGIRIWF